MESWESTSVVHLTIIKICKGTIERSVDLLVPTGAPSTSCDADVNNIKLHCPNKQLLIEQKVPVPAYTVNDSITNTRANQFNCHISFGSTRAKKLLSKGFRCLSGIPAVHQNLFTEEEQRLITFAWGDCTSNVDHFLQTRGQYQFTVFVCQDPLNAFDGEGY